MSFSTEKSFLINEGVRELLGAYPDSSLIKKVFRNANEYEQFGIIRLWITEGIPFVFKDNPLLYEEVRRYIASKLNIHPKEITLVGSARLGFSLKPDVWGRSFSERSDLDFTIISNDFFSRIVSDYQRWVEDFATKRFIPHSVKQTEYWMSSIEQVNNTISKGYINMKNLVSHNNYKNVKAGYIAMEDLKQKLCVTPNSPIIKDASIRIYSSWKNCINQIKINFDYATRS